MLASVNYHYIRDNYDQPYPGIHGLTVDQFRLQLKTLSNIGDFVSGKQVLQIVRNNETIDGNFFLITFDDGLREQYDIGLPLLDEMGIPALFFVNTLNLHQSAVTSVHKLHLIRAYSPPNDVRDALNAFLAERDIAVELPNDHIIQKQYRYDSLEVSKVKYMMNFALDNTTREEFINQIFNAMYPNEASLSRDLYMGHDEMKQLARRGYLGSHSHSHYALATLDPTEVDKEIHQTNALLKEWTGCLPYAISYPYGGQTATSVAVAETAARHGLEFGFTMERALNTAVNVEPLNLSRFDCNDVPGGKSYRLKDEEFFTSMPHRSWFLTKN